MKDEIDIVKELLNCDVPRQPTPALGPVDEQTTILPESKIQALCQDAEASSRAVAIAPTVPRDKYSMTVTADNSPDCQHRQREAINKAKEAIISLLQGRLSQNPWTGAAFVELGLVTLKETMEGMTLPGAIKGCVSLLTKLYGEEGQMQMMAELQAFSESLAEGGSSRKPQIGFAGPTKPKKETIH